MTGGRICRFLIVDDSRVSRARIRGYISDMGHEVIAEAVDGLEAVAKFVEFSPDFVTMDVEMPNLNGIDASKQILLINPDVNITLITSIVDKKITLMALRLGVRSVLQKPVEFDIFSEEISNQIRTSHEH